MRRIESVVTRSVMSINVDGYVGRGRSKKIWMNDVKDDMNNKGVR